MPMDNRSIIYISAEVVVGVISVIGNAIVLAAIVRTRQLHTITNVFVGNLAIADIAVGFLVAPFAALSFEGLPRDFYGCVLVNSLILLFTNVSILMLLAVALERFVAIKEPFTYQRLMTVRRAILINVAVWVLGTVLGLVPMYGWNSGNKAIESCQFTEVITYEYMVYFQFFGLVLLPLFVMLCIYIYIIIIVRRHTRTTHSLHRQVQHNLRNGSAPGARRGDGESREERKFNKDVRAAKMFALLILLFGILWLPVNIFNCLSLFCGADCNFTIEMLLVAIVMSHANSSINPLVYAASNSRIKRAIKNLFGHTRNVNDSSTELNVGGRTTNGATVHRDHMVQQASNSVGDVHAVNLITPTISYRPKLIPLSADADSFQGKTDLGLPSMAGGHSQVGPDHVPSMAGGHSQVGPDHVPLMAGGHSQVGPDHVPLMAGGHSQVGPDHAPELDRYPTPDTPHEIQQDTHDHDIYTLTQAGDLQYTSSNVAIIDNSHLVNSMLFTKTLSLPSPSPPLSVTKEAPNLSPPSPHAAPEHPASAHAPPERGGETPGQPVYSAAQYRRNTEPALRQHHSHMRSSSHNDQKLSMTNGYVHHLEFPPLDQLQSHTNYAFANDSDSDHNERAESDKTICLRVKEKDDEPPKGEKSRANGYTQVTTLCDTAMVSYRPGISSPENVEFDTLKDCHLPLDDASVAGMRPVTTFNVLDSRVSLKSPSLFLGMEEKSMLRNKRTEQTKL